MESLHLMVGLGNPGAEYAADPAQCRIPCRGRVGPDGRRLVGIWSSKFDARLAKVENAGRKVFFAQPQTFMNASGEAVGALMTFLSLAR